MSGFVWVFIGENLLDLLKAGEGNVDILKKVFDEFRGVYAALNSGIQRARNALFVGSLEGRLGELSLWGVE